jgi:hypothetical protein
VTVYLVKVTVNRVPELQDAVPDPASPCLSMDEVNASVGRG